MMRQYAVAFFASGAIALAGCGPSVSTTDPTRAPPTTQFRISPLLARGSPFHGVHGLRFDNDGRLTATSVIGQSIFRVDTTNGAIERVVGPREGMADDLAFATDGTMYWTAIEDGILYSKAPNGPVRKVVENMKGVNAISFNRDRTRLFFSLVFYGDALYELDLTGAKAPRLVADNIGGLNAFQVGDDGKVYGPLMFKGQIAKIDPDTGAVTTIASDLTSPGALKLDGKGSAYVLDDQKLKRFDLASGTVTASAMLPYDPDNLAIDKDGRVFVSMAAPNAIAEVNVETAAVRYVTGPSQLNSPTGLTVGNVSGRDALYVGDLFGGIRQLDGASGLVREMPTLELFQPAHVFATEEHLLVASQVAGIVQQLDRTSLEVLASWDGFKSPGDAAESLEGDIIVVETGTGRVLNVTGPEAGDREVLAEGLNRPTGLAIGQDGAVFVAETGGGRVLKIGPGDAPMMTLAEGLERPEGIAFEQGGDNLVVVEVGAKRITRIEPSGAKTVLAQNLPVGLSDGPSLFRGIAVGTTATTIYFSSDVDNTIYRLTPKQRN
jgi:sugar lactone lactonase YvrE